jgi:anti-sigma regulatory factor (Ser/Thr protein kinase)
MAGDAFPHHWPRGGREIDPRRSGGAARAHERCGGYPRAAPGSDLQLTLPARAENIAVIRHALAALGDALAVPEPVVNDMRLAVTEACTNIVRHAYTGGHGSMDVMVRPRDESLEVVVTDAGRGMGPSPDKAGPGLGLPLIAALTDSFDIEALEAGSRLVMSFRRDRVRASVRTA